MGWDANFTTTQLAANPSAALNIVANVYAITSADLQQQQHHLQQMMTQIHSINLSFLVANRFLYFTLPGSWLFEQ
jgi:hypothetical protein